ncbi:MAG: putative phage abortive infection protein [Hydrogenophaga sp.]|uniref:putative phage abortive infection protein n=1 Tax=Hydrogenophaga sp. TaxID=1904254 RepID=UPI00276D98BD|nr:putative phage abortive infection protein [Hydrogenophaga sp.]MDP2418938.1 putative phage abortive infection protein [Hydrogenophaga sp.]MDZ4186636.1 putative phage abortive infection protein [Hydrogenophaga sp.]
MLLVPAAFALGAVLAYAMAFSQLPATEDPGAWGTFGDFLGGLLNPLVSTLTLFVAASVWKLQREELALTRKALEQTQLAMEEQAKTAEQQRQEQRFFDLLNVYYQTVNVISYTRLTTKGVERGYRDYNGKAAMAAWLRNALELHDFVLNRGSVGTNNDPTDHADEIQHMDRMFVNWQDYEAREYFDSYFRVVSHLLAEVKGLLGEQHHRYVVLFRSQLSKSELVLLAYHFWLDPESKQSLLFAETYALLQDLDRGDLRTELEKEFGYFLFGLRTSEKQEVLASTDTGSPEIGSSASKDTPPRV